MLKVRYNHRDATAIFSRGQVKRKIELFDGFYRFTICTKYVDEFDLSVLIKDGMAQVASLHPSADNEVYLITMDVSELLNHCVRAVCQGDRDSFTD